MELIQGIFQKNTVYKKYAETLQQQYGNAMAIALYAEYDAILTERMKLRCGVPLHHTQKLLNRLN